MADEVRTVKVLVARMDGTGRSGFALGAIQPMKDVPVLLDFNAFDASSLVGHADLTVEGDKVYATIKSTPGLEGLFKEGLFPSIGFRAVSHHAEAGAVIVDKCEALAVGVHVSPNQDPDIPPIKADPAQ